MEFTQHVTVIEIVQIDTIYLKRAVLRLSQNSTDSTVCNKMLCDWLSIQMIYEGHCIEMGA